VTSRTAPVPERRQLTVMFCDLVGSTAMAQRLDPEDLRALILRFQQLVRDLVARYEGFVARYMGDGVLVYFGYPVAHEDDAARAIHAGLGIVSAAQLLDPPLDPSGQPAPLRVGIATGVVVVGDRIGAGAAEEAAAVGEAPNLASRLQSWAEPQTVLVADRTQQLAGSRFVYAAPRELTLKGYLQPVRAWTVLRSSSERSRFGQTHATALTPWVGRSDELARLLDLWRRRRAASGSSCSSLETQGSASRASCKRWATGSSARRSIAFAISARRTTSTARFIPSFTSSKRRPGLPPAKRHPAALTSCADCSAVLRRRSAAPCHFLPNCSRCRWKGRRRPGHLSSAAKKPWWPS
jgi:Adenylate cyclase, family 3 (some proteins contain HAMP domain)